MIVALRDEDRIDCAAHVLNTVLRNTFDNKNCPEPIRLMIKAAKELVRYLKKTSHQNLMQKQVKQSCETRWNSTFLMLKSMHDAHGDIQKLFADHVPLQMSRVTAVDVDMLRNVQNFLKVSLWLFQYGYILYKISCFCNSQWNELK